MTAQHRLVCAEFLEDGSLRFRCTVCNHEIEVSFDSQAEPVTLIRAGDKTARHLFCGVELMENVMIEQHWPASYEQREPNRLEDDYRLDPFQRFVSRWP